MSYENRKEYFRKYQKEYQKKLRENPKFMDKRAAWKRKMYRNNQEWKEMQLLYNKEYAITQKGIEVRRKSNIKRKRQLGFNPINDCFNGSDAHHINKTDVIYIPTALHEAHYGHRLDRPKTMIEINRIAFQYLINTVKQL